VPSRPLNLTLFKIKNMQCIKFAICLVLCFTYRMHFVVDETEIQLRHFERKL